MQREVHHAQIEKRHPYFDLKSHAAAVDPLQFRVVQRHQLVQEQPPFILFGDMPVHFVPCKQLVASVTAQDDNRRARLAIRYILCNSAITAPIPGLISPAQVDNMALAIKERRQLDVEERAELEQASTEMWASLPAGYQWLKGWQYV